MTHNQLFQFEIENMQINYFPFILFVKRKVAVLQLQLMNVAQVENISLKIHQIWNYVWVLYRLSFLKRPLIGGTGLMNSNSNICFFFEANFKKIHQVVWTNSLHFIHSA